MDLNRIVVGGNVMGFWRKTILDLGQMEAYKRRGELVQSIRFSTTTHKFRVSNLTGILNYHGFIPSSYCYCLNWFLSCKLTYETHKREYTLFPHFSPLPKKSSLIF